MSDNIQALPSAPNYAFDTRWRYFNSQPIMDMVNSAGSYDPPFQPLHLTPQRAQASQPGYYRPSSTQGSTMPSHSPRLASSPGDFTNFDSGYGESRPAFSATTPSVTGTNRTRRPANLIQCKLCPRQFKNNSEIKKHMNQHTKPNKCDFDGCVKGFATPNDLKRHKRTVHKEVYQDENDAPRFKCTHCTQEDTPQNNRRKREDWPRKDNFTAHLERVHKIKGLLPEDLERYIVTPEPSAGTPRGRNEEQEDALRCVGSGAAYSDDFLGPSQYPRTIWQPSGSQSDQYTQQRVETFEQRYRGRLHINPQNLAVDGMLQFDANGNTRDPVVGSHSPDSLDPGLLNIGLSTGVGDGSSFQLIQPEGTGALFSSQGVMPLDPGPQQFGEYFAGQMGEMSTQDSERDSVLGHSWIPDTLDTLDGSETNTPETSELDDADADADADGDVDAEGEVTPTECSRNTSHEELASFLQASRRSEQQRPSFMAFLKTVPKEMLQEALQSQVSDNNGANDDGSDAKDLIKCPHTHCPKLFKRPCDLKKHVKRHKKPYGCTHRDCNKTFGSKNDWKRHESSQHFNIGSWQCAQAACDKICSPREMFCNHLNRDHGIRDAKIINTELERRRIGRFGDNSFWCGFCVEVVEVGLNEAGNALTKRFDHIDDHLFGKNGLPQKTSDEWQHQDGPGNDGRPSQKVLGKRPTMDNGASCMPNKRRSPSCSQMWRCCNCYHVMNTKTSPSCIECNHPRCEENCIMETTNISEYECLFASGPSGAGTT